MIQYDSLQCILFRGSFSSVLVKSLVPACLILNTSPSFASGKNILPGAHKSTISIPQLSLISLSSYSLLLDLP